MSDETNSNDADDAAFEELINNQPASDEDGPVELSTLWDGFEYIWKKFNSGSVLVRGIVFAEYIDDEGKHSFKWQCSPDMAPWAALGMLQQALLDVQADSVAQTFVEILTNQEEDEDESDEDIQ